MAEKEESVVKTEEKELKEVLLRLVKKILEEDDCRIEVITEAIKILFRLKDLKLGKPVGIGIGDTVLAEKFKCPISREIMADPVVLESGQTFDREHIQKWLNDGNLTCPVSKQVLSHSNLTPNDLVRDLILLWLLEKLSSSSPTDQKEAAKELRRLTKISSSCRAVFCEIPDAISKLLVPLSLDNIESDPDLQVNLITTVFNLSVHDKNRKLLGEHPKVLPVLIESLRFGITETKGNAAATLCSLSELHSNKDIIGKFDAHVPLLALLREGPPEAMQGAASSVMDDAALAISELCTDDDIKEKFIEIEAVTVILDKINNGIVNDKLLKILALLSTHEDATFQLGDKDTVNCLLEIIRRDGTSNLAKESCVAILYDVVILYNMCSEDRDLFQALKTAENEHHTLAKLADTVGINTTARRMARRIIQKITA